MGKEIKAERTSRNSARAQVTKDIKRKMKPITEKIRRERINNSLHELKILVLSAMNKDVLRYAKMEKADILDMAVKYIKCIQTAREESRDGCDRPTRGKPASIVTPSDKSPADTNDASCQQPIPRSRSLNIDAKTSCSGMMSLVQPDIRQPHYTTLVTMATQQNHTLSPVPGYVSSGLSKDVLRTRMTTVLENISSNCPNESSTFLRSRSSLENVGATPNCPNVQSPLGDKMKNKSGNITDRKKVLSAMNNVAKTKHDSSKEINQDNVRLPGMECFVKNMYLHSEQLKENQIYNIHVLANQEREVQIDHFDSSQYLLPLWRPW